MLCFQIQGREVLDFYKGREKLVEFTLYQLCLQLAAKYISGE